jgi:TolB-like protein/Flp pilus assembly protein TadD
MSDPSPAPSSEPAEQASEVQLDSWKEIASYVRRDVSTVQRWEKREGMPVHRHLHDKRGSVYALGSELNAWLESRKDTLPEEETEPAEPPSDEKDETRRKDPPMWHRLAIAGAALLAVLVAGYFINSWRGEHAAKAKITSLAVLPLKNLSSDPAQEYFAEGMTEALIGQLSGIRDLRVTSRTSVMRFKDTQLSVPEIAGTLHVDAIVEGSVIRDGNRIRVHAQLIRTATDEHLWAESYDRELGDVLALQSDVALAIAEKVEVSVSGQGRQRLKAVRSTSPEVYENYLKGQFTLGKSNDKASVDKSINYFQAAIDKDPGYAPAYLGLAEAYSELRTIFIGIRPQDVDAKIQSAAQKALELDPESVEAHVLLGKIEDLQWQWADAERQLRRALEISPNNANAHAALSDWFLHQGRTDESLAWAERGRELDPASFSGDNIGWILFCSRRYEEAIREFRTVLAVRPDDAGALWYLGFALIADNRPEEAIPVLEKALTASEGSPGIRGVLVRAYAHAGRRADALRVLGDLKRRKLHSYVPAAAFVNAYLGLDDKEQAFAWLDQAYKEHSNILLFVKVHPYFDPLRNDPRFRALVSRTGLSQ